MLHDIPMSKPGRNYRERLICLANWYIYKDVDPEVVKRAINDRRIKEGDEVAEDYTKICRAVWIMKHKK